MRTYRTSVKRGLSISLFSNEPLYKWQHAVYSKENGGGLVILLEKTTKPLASPQKMMREEDKDAAVCKIVEKLQNSSLFLEMKADLEVKLDR